jgi:hypothetical protein
LTLTFNYYLETQPGGLDQALVYLWREGFPLQLVARNTPGPGLVTLKDPSGGWQTASIDLLPYAGSTIWLYIFFFTADSSANNFAGFYLDDIAVWSCYSEEVLNLVSQTVSSQEVFRACDTVTAGSSFVVAPSGKVTLRAGKRIVLNPGFSVAPGGTLTAATGPPEQ